MVSQNCSAVNVLAAGGSPVSGKNSMIFAPLTSRIRELLFVYQDGLMLCLIADSLSQGGVLKISDEEVLDVRDRLPGGKKPTCAYEIAKDHGGKPAYLEVALRSLAQQGWLDRVWNEASQQWHYKATTAFLETTSSELDAYRRVGECLATGMPFERSVLRSGAEAGDLAAFAALVTEAAAGWPKCLSHTVRQHLTGALLVPVLLGLHLSGKCDPDSTNLAELPKPVLDLLASAGFLDSRRRGWSEDGKVARRHAIYLGLAGSYAPTLTRLHSLMFGDFAPPTHSKPGQVELHVDRELNVLASAAAHSKYFAAANEIIIDIFDRTPLEAQPAFVMDMGCGDGSWLVHIHEVILHRTVRGKNLKRHPILMVGVDYNAVCEGICLEAFQQNGIQGRFMLGDVTNPEAIAAALAADGLDMRNGLHVRSFIDHNRIYREPRNPIPKGSRLPTGAYVSADDQPITPGNIRQSLVEFFESWARYAEPHGLLVIEAHCVTPDLTARHLGSLHSLVFDTYHGFSRQYPVDFEVFMECAEEAGLRSVPYQQHRYPSRKPFVAISINRFTKCPSQEEPCFPKIQEAPTKHPSGNWVPSAGGAGSDGLALHKFLYQDGVLHRQRDWCRDATGRLVGDVLRHIRKTVPWHNAEQPKNRVFHIVDYGAGSGMATIEVLRAMLQTGIFHQFQDAGIGLRLSLLDLPGDWFTMGHALLADCPLVEFHSLRDSQGGIRQLPEIFGDTSVDIIIANMVFHLVPPKALPTMFRGFGEALVEQGLLAWNSPDIGPASADSCLFHDVNRASRRELLKYLKNPSKVASICPKSWSPETIHAFESRASELTQENLMACEAIAKKQILSDPNTLGVLSEAACSWFKTSGSRTANYNISADDLLELALIPSNRKIFAEIANLDCFEKILAGIQREKVMPVISNINPLKNNFLSIQWTFGLWRKLADINHSE